MTALPVSGARCNPAELLGLLSPGQVIGLYQGTQWIDWSAPPAPGLDILSNRADQLWRGERQRFHFVVDSNPDRLGPYLECLAHLSRGVALVSSRLGAMLQFASRIVALPAYPQRTSGPFRTRTSGAVLVFRETTLRVLERGQVIDSATLTLAVQDPARAVRVMESSFPSLQVDHALLHLELRGHYPEEVLGRLRDAGISVRASAVWYRLLQTCPLRIEGLKD